MGHVPEYQDSESMEPITKRILIACIIASIIGITLITALDYYGDTRTANITEIDSKMAGENIIICGIMKSKSVSKSGTIFMTLADKSSKVKTAQTIPLIFFKNEVHETENISKGLEVCVRGTILIYNRSAEIIGRKITIIE